MTTQEILMLLGFAVFVIALPLFCAGLIHLVAERAKKL